MKFSLPLHVLLLAALSYTTCAKESSIRSSTSIKQRKVVNEEVHSNNKNIVSRGLQSPDTMAIFSALSKGTGDTISIVFSEAANILMTLVTNPTGLMEAIAQALANIVATVVSILINVGAAALPGVISAAIGSFLESFDPYTLDITHDPAYLKDDGVCTWNYTVSSLTVSGSSSYILDNLSIEDLGIEGDTFFGSANGEFLFAELLCEFAGDLIAVSGGCVDTPFTAVATLTEPGAMGEGSFSGQIFFNETTGTDMLLIDEVEVTNVDLKNLDGYTWNTNDSALIDALSGTIDDIIGKVESATSNITAFMDIIGANLPYTVDSGMDIPLF